MQLTPEQNAKAIAQGERFRRRMERAEAKRLTLEKYAGYYAAPRDVDETVNLVGLGAKAGRLGDAAELADGHLGRREVERPGDPRAVLRLLPSRGTATGPSLRCCGGHRPENGACQPRDSPTGALSTGPGARPVWWPASPTPPGGSCHWPAP